MAQADGRQRCLRCDAWLASDNLAELCSPCQSKSPDRPVVPRDVPADFWQDGELRAALASRHMGRVIRAYRNHPYRGRRGLSQEDIARWAGKAQGQVSKIEGQSINRLDTLIFWAQLLGIPERYLWFKLPHDAPAGGGEAGGNVGLLPAVKADRGSELVVRSDPLHLGLAPAPVSALIDGITATPLPVQVTPVEINQIRDAASFFEGWDFAYGGGIVREAVMAQLRWSAALLDADCETSRRDDLFSAVGYLAHTCAFMAFDDLATDDAWHMWRLALACAEEATDWPLRATILSALARQAMWLGRFDDGLTLAELALVRADRLTTIEQAKLHATKARLLAAMKRPTATLAALEAADTCFAGTAPADVPPWMTYYDTAEHAGDTGHALADLALRDHRPDDARARLTTAIAGHTPEFARFEALCQAKVATLVMAVGDPHEAVQLGHAAIDRAGAIRSRRLDHYLGELAQQTDRHRTIIEVTELSERLADRQLK